VFVWATLSFCQAVSAYRCIVAVKLWYPLQLINAVKCYVI